MKISKSELQKIINEEVHNVFLSEDWKQKAADAGKAGLGFVGDVVGAFGRGMAGAAADQDNPIARGVHHAYGSRLMPKIDKLLKDAMATVEELDANPEGDKLKNNDPDVISDFLVEFRDLLELWADITGHLRGGDWWNPNPPTPVPEALRREVRKEIKKHFNS